MGFFGPKKEKKWESIGLLEGRHKVRAVGAGTDGFGLIGCETEPDIEDLTERLKGRKAKIVRATPHGLSTVYEGAEWFVALHGRGPAWAAVIGIIKDYRAGGSNYRLLRSVDSGMTWEERGAIPASSVTQVLMVNPEEIWVLGAKCLAHTSDAGGVWTPDPRGPDINSTRDRLCFDQDHVHLLGQGVARWDQDKWSQLMVTRGDADVCDLENSLFLLSDKGSARIAKLDGFFPKPFSTLSGNRDPIKLVSTGKTLRVLSRDANPARGPHMCIDRSEDNGRKWSRRSLGLSPMVDIAGSASGLGVDIIGRVYGRLE